MEIKTLLAVMAAIVAAMILGEGITGFITSESCCIGSDCPLAQACPVTETPNPNIVNGLLIIFGTFAIVVVLFYLFVNRDNLD